MSEREEKPWRDGLEHRGKDWALRALNSRYGQPTDVVLDVVFVEPYPTREFVLRWCAEQGNKPFKLSPTTIAALVTCAFVLIAVQMAVSSLNNYQPQKANDEYLTPYGTRVTPGDVLTNNFPDPAATATGATTPRATTLPSICAYATYPTAACPQK